MNSKTTLRPTLRLSPQAKRAGMILIVVLTLTACASGTPPIAVTPRSCSASLTTDCPAPPPARSGKLLDLLDNHIEAMELYAQCRDQLTKLAECANSEAGR